MGGNLRAGLPRPGCTKAYVKLLRGVVASLDYFSPKEPRGAGYPERKARADREAGTGRGAPADEARGEGAGDTAGGGRGGEARGRAENASG